MNPIFLSDLASRKTAYLAARQVTLATNVANLNTPGYRAQDLVPFDDVLSQTQLKMTSTDAGHIPVSGLTDGAAVPVNDQDAPFETTETGNSVGVEQQLSKAGEVNRQYALTTNIVKSFHAMLMASLRE